MFNKFSTIWALTGKINAKEMCKCFNNLMANFNNLIKTGMSALNARHWIKSKFNKTLCDQFSKFTLSANFNVVILTRLQVKLFKGKKTFTTNSISKLCKIFYAWIIKQFKIFIHIIQVSQKFSINSLDVVNNVIFLAWNYQILASVFKCTLYGNIMLV